METTARRSKTRTILFVMLAFIGGIALTLGAVWAFGGDRQESQSEASAAAEATQDDEMPEVENSAPEEAKPGSSAADTAPAAYFTLDTARDACDVELRDRFSGLDLRWDDRRSVQKQEGDAWFFKAPASGGPYPGENWAKCKVGGTPEHPEWYVVRVN